MKNEKAYALKTELNYQSFRVMDSGEAISYDYQKCPYRIVFDDNHDLRH
jgi:hypothetical protein